MPTPTIAAVSSPPGRAARGLIRISGPDALAVTRAVADPLPDLPGISQARLRRLGIPVLATVFRAPRSFTGEDTVELQAPGHPTLLARILRGLHAAGARPAAPGAFTHRAFRAGKLTLLEAEAVAATIAAENDAQLEAARRLGDTRGPLQSAARDLAEELAATLALVEAGIDFTDEEDVVAISDDDLTLRLRNLADRADALAAAPDVPETDRLPRIALAGEPSSGKSTLFNALLGRDRAVVDAAPHTTRDVIEAPWRLPAPPGSPQTVMLIDTAGYGVDVSATNPTLHGDVPTEAQARAQDAVLGADLVLNLIPPDQWDEHRTERPDFPPSWIRVASRADEAGGAPVPPGLLRLSIHDRPGLNTLIDHVASRLAAAGSPGSRALLAEAGPRHRRLFDRLATTLTDAQHQPFRVPELDAAALRHALDLLGELTGTQTPDDIIGRVFATFCIGK